MKLTFILLTALALQVAAKGYTQSITLSVKDAPLEKVFESITLQSGYSFFYNEEQLQKSRPVTINVKAVSLEEALNICLKDQSITYTIVNKVIVIKTLNKTGGLQVSSSPPGNGEAMPINVKGKVTNEKGEPAAGVTVTIKGTTIGTSTNSRGEFSLSSVDGEAVLVFTSVNMETFEYKVRGKTELVINLKTKISALGDVTVTVNMGIEKISKERATSSFEFVSSEELNRRTGSTILDRLEGVSSVFFDRRGLSPSSGTVPLSNIMIRGLSTLTVLPEAIKQPLIILNNFPYEGNINNINPNDVESMTILRDAGATSIYGTRAANGVIVITTKQGKFNQPPQLSFNSNITIIQNPDLFHLQKMSSSDFIDVEKYLFDQGFYDADLADTRYPALSPVVEILDKQRSGVITEAEATAQINNLRTKDIRNDFKKYVYRKSVSQQYFINYSGGSEKYTYSLGAGFDNNIKSLRGDEDRRITINSYNIYTPVKKLTIQLDVRYANTLLKNNSLGELNSPNYGYRQGDKKLLPYTQFVDNNGNHLTIPRDLRKGYTDTTGGGQLLNWEYSPLDELSNNSNRTNEQEIVLNTGVNYKIADFLTFEAGYQFQHSNGERNFYYSDQAYYTRNLVNLFTNLDSPDPYLRNPIPVGGILDQDIYEQTSHYGRGLFRFNKSWKGRHEITALAGGEIREGIATSTGMRSYGYNKENLSSFSVDYVNSYPQYDNRGYTTIPAGLNNLSAKKTDHFISFFANAAYNFKSRYIISASLRRDAANVFGVNINDKWKPFWSVGASWNLSNEPFFRMKSVSYLKLRATYGYQGNVNNSLSPYTIISYSSPSSSPYNLPFATIRNPANPGLTWENTNQVNLGLDFRILNDRLSGSLDMYKKRSKNLILSAATDITTGIGSIARNSADMSGKGIDFSLSSINIKSPFSWNTEFAFSYIRNKVDNTQIDPTGVMAEGIINNGLSITTMKGISPYALFSFPFAGLDPLTGDPQGYLGKTISTDYQAILSQLFDTANIIYHGSAIPTVFGYLNNIFSYKELTITMNISYRFGYYARKSTISYYGLYNQGLTHVDYSNRWKQPGDENHTTIPSMIYPVQDSRRDDFYAFSSANILKGDNIRLQYIKVGYDITKAIKKLPLRSIQIYALIDNLGIIWRANKEGLDPDYDAGNAAYPVPKKFVVGLKLGI